MEELDSCVDCIVAPRRAEGGEVPIVGSLAGEVDEPRRGDFREGIAEVVLSPPAVDAFDLLLELIRGEGDVECAMGDKAKPSLGVSD